MDLWEFKANLVYIVRLLPTPASGKMPSITEIKPRVVVDARNTGSREDGEDKPSLELAWAV